MSINITERQRSCQMKIMLLIWTGSDKNQSGQIGAITLL